MPSQPQKAKLTKSLVDALKPQAKEYSVWDVECDSFHVRVYPNGSKVFYVFFRHSDGSKRKQSRRSLGNVKTKTVLEARREAQAIVVGARRNLDPFVTEENARAIPTLGEFWPDYLKFHALPKKAASSVREDESLWRNHLAEAFAEIQVSRINRQSVRDWHASKHQSKPSANRALSLLSKMLTLCVDNGYIDSNPCFGVARFTERARDRYLNPDELRRLFHALDVDHDEGGAALIKLLLLTGARRGEAMYAEWNEFDFESGVWTVPKEHMKGGERRSMNLKRPLNEQTVEVLRIWRRRTGRETGLVFPSPLDQSKARYCVKSIWERVCKRARLNGVRLHDLRRTFASLALQNGASLDQIGRVLAHGSPQTTQRYAHLSGEASLKVANSVGRSINKIVSGD